MKVPTSPFLAHADVVVRATVDGFAKEPPEGWRGVMTVTLKVRPLGIS